LESLEKMSNTKPLEISPKVCRLIDANLNRLKEGVRVVEDIARFVNDDKELAYRLKKIRHKAKLNNIKDFLKHRNIIGDVLKSSISSEQNRDSLSAIITSNIKRAQESARVLEESFKLIDITQSELFKSIRYELYDIEKQLIIK